MYNSPFVGDEKLILMTRDLEPYFEAELNPADFGQGNVLYSVVVFQYWSLGEMV